jgi:AAA domain
MINNAKHNISQEELDSYTSSSYTKSKKNTKGTNSMSSSITRTPISKSATDTKESLSTSPFKIVSGIKTAQKWLNLFIYGDFGSGKTVLSAQSVDVPNMQDVLFINIEGGIVSVLGSKAVENHDKIDVVDCSRFEDLVSIHRMLIAYCQARDDNDTARISKMAVKYGFDPNKRYKTVVIDSLSELNAMSLARAFGDDSNDLLSSANSDDTRRDFGRNKSAMLKVVRAFRNLPMHVIATCGRQWDEDERKKLGFQPRLTGALAKEIQAFWDVVGFLQTTAVKNDDEESSEPTMLRRLWLQPIGKFDAKNRLSDQSITHIDNPTMLRLVRLINPKTAEDNTKSAKQQPTTKKQVA